MTDPDPDGRRLVLLSEIGRRITPNTPFRAMDFSLAMRPWLRVEKIGRRLYARLTPEELEAVVLLGKCHRYHGAWPRLPPRGMLAAIEDFKRNVAADPDRT